MVAVDEDVVDRAQRGQASGDDSDCVFNKGPDGGRDECPGRVRRGEAVQDGHAIDASYADKASEEEDAYELDLPFQLDVQAPDHRHR